MPLIYAAIGSLAFVYPQSSKGVLVSLLIIGSAQLPSIRSREP